MPSAARQLIDQAFTSALGVTFLVAAILAFMGFCLSRLLPELKLRKTIASGSAQDYGKNAAQALAMPSDPNSLAVLVNAIVRLADRDVQRRHITRIVQRAAVALNPPAAWLLIKVEENSGARSQRIEPKLRSRTQQIGQCSR